jgi:hypothetical protein
VIFLLQSSTKLSRASTVKPLKATVFCLAVELIQDPSYRVIADGRLEFSFFVHC